MDLMEKHCHSMFVVGVARVDCSKKSKMKKLDLTNYFLFDFVVFVDVEVV